MTQPSEAHPHPELKRVLGIWSAAAIVVGTVIGSGIFLVPSSMIQNVGTPLMVFAVWVFGGLLTLFGALSYAELAAAMPEAGGEYVYLREAYGPLWGFLYGWTQMWVAKSGSIATLATGFFIYLANFQPRVGKGLGGSATAVGRGRPPARNPLWPVAGNGRNCRPRPDQLLRRASRRQRSGLSNCGQGAAACRDHRDWIRNGSRDFRELSHLHAGPGRHRRVFRGLSGGFMGLRRLEQRGHGGLRGSQAAAQPAPGTYTR